MAPYIPYAVDVRFRSCGAVSPMIGPLQAELGHIRTLVSR